MGSRAGLDAVKKENKVYPCRESTLDTTVSQPLTELSRLRVRSTFNA
jgi:hypothetical protein